MTRFEYLKDKLVSQEEARRRIVAWKLKGEKVCFTNGCFDILHLGHIHYLAASAELGNRLIVAINSDVSVKKLNKAENRPINKEEARMLLIAALGFVDLVLVFNEQTPLDLIKYLQPDILLKGSDYDAAEKDSSNSKYIVGSKEVSSNGGSVCTVDFLPGYSTTLILHKGN